MGPTSPTPHERAAALLRRQQTTTARLRAGLPALLDQLDRGDDVEIDVVATGHRSVPETETETETESRSEPEPEPEPEPVVDQAATGDSTSSPTTRAR